MTDQEKLMVSAKITALEDQAKIYKRTAELFCVCGGCAFVDQCEVLNNLNQCPFGIIRLNKLDNLNKFYEVAKEQIKGERKC